MPTPYQYHIISIIAYIQGDNIFMIMIIDAQNDLCGNEKKNSYFVRPTIYYAAQCIMLYMELCTLK